jgi:hypothetical protein
LQDDLPSYGLAPADKSADRDDQHRVLRETSERRSKPVRALGAGHNLIDYLLAYFIDRSSVASGDIDMPGQI